MIGSVSDAPGDLSPHHSRPSGGIAYVILSEDAKKDLHRGANGEKEALADILHVELPPGKRGQAIFLDCVLPLSIPFIDAHLSRGAAVCIYCDTGNDASVGVALAGLQLLFDDNGDYVEQRGELSLFRSRAMKTNCDHAEKLPAPNKKSISTRLQWIIASRPQANPSRAILKRVNEFLMTPPTLRRKLPMSTKQGAACIS